MMSEEETTEDRKISRRRPNWRSDRMNKWMDELDRRGTDLWKVARKERVDGPVLQSSATPNWFASLDGLLMRTLHESIISFVHLPNLK